MGNTPNCCERDENIDNIIEERNEIFNFSPEDDKVPDDASFISNHGGEYPIESEEQADFRYEAKYPNLVNSEKIIIRNLPQEKIYENDENEDLNQEMEYYEQQNVFDMNNIQRDQMMKLKQLFDLCNRNGKPRSCEDFNPEGYTMFYAKDDPYFYYDKNNVFGNTLKIYNENDKYNIQIYQGDVNVSGQRHGIGKCTTPYYVLMGMWKNDTFSGWGRESRTNGDVFEGRYENGVLNGKGIFLNEKKCKYVGDFISTRRWGKGELTTDKIHYEGDFYDNKMHGNGRIRFLRDGIEYMGTFKDDQIDGFGVFKWKNGDMYKGYVKAGKMNGFGKYKYANGKEYSGYFNRGEKCSEKMRKYLLWRQNGYGVGSQNLNQIENNLEQNGGEVGGVGGEELNSQGNLEQQISQPGSNN